jgi:hypothetical protein
VKVRLESSAGQRESALFADFGVKNVPQFYLYIPGAKSPQEVKWYAAWRGEWPISPERWIDHFEGTIETSLRDVKIQAALDHKEAQTFLKARGVKW